MFDEKSIYNTLSYLPEQLKCVVRKVGQGAAQQVISKELKWAKENNWQVTILDAATTHSDFFMDVDGGSSELLKSHHNAVFDHVLDSKDHVQGTKVIRYKADPSRAIVIERVKRS